MKLIPTKIPIKVGNKYIAVLNKHTAHQLDLHPGDRILLQNGRKGQLRTILEVSENSEIRNNQIALYSETWAKLKVNRGDKISVKISDKPLSIMYIRHKLTGATLNKEELNEIVQDIVAENLSDTEIAYFVAGCQTNGLTNKEIVELTKAIVENGNRLKFRKKLILDKHCIGGVPGNRTTMIIVPIITALGLTMPKTSSRAITSPSGTADTMEVLANVCGSLKNLQKNADKVGGFISWGGCVNLAAADDKMIRARHSLSLDPPGMLLASIMGKKHSVGANHLLIDIPMGKQVKVKNKKEAKELGDKFKLIGKKLGIKVATIYSKGDQPIGNGIGPILEAIDVMKILQNEKDAPQDLKNKSLEMAGLLLELCKKARRGKGKKIAKQVLESGKAYEQMQKIIEAQGPQHSKLQPGKFTKTITAPRKGKVKSIHNKLLSHIARSAGAPQDPSAGIYLHKKLKNRVKKGDPLYTIHAGNKARLKFTEQYDLNATYKIS